jgi:signal transduction histidine kinase
VPGNLDRSTAGDFSFASEVEPGRRGLMLGILSYRIVSFALTVVLAAVVELRAPAATWSLLAAVGIWIAAITWQRAWERRWVRWVDVGVSATLLIAAPFLAAEGFLLKEPLFVVAYPVSSVMLWAATRGVGAGLAAGIVLAVPLAAARWLNGTPLDEHDLGATLGIVTVAVYYATAGVLIGLFTRTMERAARDLRSANEEAARERERAARLREREAMARTIHDSILQSLALVHRRGRELAGRTSVEPDEVEELVGLVDAQERELRTLLRGAPAEPPTGSVPLRTVLEAGAFGIAGVEVSVSTVEPAWVAAGAAAEVSAAVRAALDNVVRHAAATSATIFGECEDGQVVVSIRDDGVGFEPDALGASNGRFGIAHSIVGRIEDLGGEVRIDSAPGRGTEVEFRVPVEATEATT